MAIQYYYNSDASKPLVVDTAWVATYGGIDPATSTPDELAASGYYSYTPKATAQFDDLTEEITGVTWTISGTTAEDTSVITNKSLEDVKVRGIEILDEALNDALTNKSSVFNYPLLRLIVEASKTQANRDAGVQTAFTDMGTLITDYTTNVDAVNAATTVAEVVAIVRP